MRFEAVVGSAVLASACTDPPGGIGPTMPDCSFTEAVEQVDASEVDHLDAMLGYLANTQPTAARWWNGDPTEVVVQLDTEAPIPTVEQTTYTFDPVTSSADATEAACGTLYRYWRLSLPLVAAETTDGGLSAAASEVELVCANDSDSRLGDLWPEEGLPDGRCGVSVAFDVPVDLVEERVPPGQTGPFVAEVSVAGWWGGEIMAAIPSGAPTGADDPQTGMAGVPAPILHTEPPT